jgi:hypothetical protein
VIIEQRERMAAPAAAEREVALEVHLPKFIGRRAFEAHVRAVLRRLREIDQAAPPQDRPDGRRRGQFRHAEILEPPSQLARTPCRVLRPQRRQPLFERRLGAVRRALWPPRTIRQSRAQIGRPTGTRQPLVSTLAADPKAPAQFGDVRARRAGEAHKLKTKGYGIFGHPGHRPSVTHVPEHLSPMSSVHTRRGFPHFAVRQGGGRLRSPVDASRIPPPTASARAVVGTRGAASLPRRFPASRQLDRENRISFVSTAFLLVTVHGGCRGRRFD